MKFANDNNIVVKPENAPEFRLTINEHDSWSGPDRYFRFFDTLDAAIAAKEKALAHLRADRALNKPTPEYYITVGPIHQVVRNGKDVFVGKEVG